MTVVRVIIQNYRTSLTYVWFLRAKAAAAFSTS